MSSIANAIVAAAQAAGIDPKLALEVANRESGLNQNARGAAGEIGVFQLLPSTAASLGVDPSDVNRNIEGGVRYLAQLLSRYGDPAAALAAYNWGPDRVDADLAAHGSAWFSFIPSSTQSYVTSILANVQTQYTASIGPIPLPGGGPSSFRTGISAEMPPAPPPGMSVWTKMAIAVGVIFGLSLLLSD